MRYEGTDLAWAAGFLEADGCFQIGVGREGRNIQPKVTAAQVDKQPLVKLQNLFGGSLHWEPGRGNHSAKWSWAITTRFCQEVIPLLIPYMAGEKKRQAKFISDFSQSLRPQNGIRVSDRELRRRLEAKRKLQAMKLRNQNKERRCAV